MKHLFTLSERLKGRWRGSVTSAISATSASAIFCKLVGMVKLFMPFMKATKRQSDTTFFAESLKSLKSLMSNFAESAESAKSAKPIFANRGVKDVRVSLAQYPTNIQRISNLYLTPNRYLTRFAAVFALVFVLGVGNVWGANKTYTKINSTSSLSTGDKCLIVCESQTNNNGDIRVFKASVASNGAGTESEYISKSNNSITCDENYAFTLTSTDATNWKITGAKGSIGHISGSNTLGVNTTVTNTISFDNNGNAVIGCDSRVLRCNANNGTPLFRYYSNTQKTVQLYKEVASSTPTLSISGNVNSLEMGDAKVNGSGVTNNTLSFSGSNLTANVSLAINGTNASMFNVSPTNVNKGTGTITNQSITITYNPTSAGSHSATLTISSNGASQKTITLSGTGKYEVTWKCVGSDDVTTLVASGSRPTFPSTPTSCDTGEGASTTFAGWTKTTWSGKKDKSYIDGLTTEATKVHSSNSTMSTITANGTIYHAVFCKKSGGSVTLTASDFHDRLDASYGDKTITKTIGGNNYIFNINACEPNNTGNKCQMRDNSTISYIQIPSLPGVITRLTSTSFTNASDAAYTGVLHFKSSKTRGNSNTNDISKLDCSSGITSLDWDLSSDNSSATTGYLVTSAGLRMTDLTIYYGSADGTNYMTSCCTALAQVEGSVNVNNINEGGGQATWSWTGATTGISKNILKVYNASTDALVKTIDNISASATSQSIIGLETCTSYYATLTTVASTGYCEGEEQGKSENFTTNGWAVHYEGGDETEGALLSHVTKKSGAITACTSENYVATFEAQTGYKLPNNITVYIAGGEQTVNEDYTWSISNGVGTLTIFTSELNEEIDVRIIGEELGCAADPSIGAASLSGDFNLSTVGVTVGTSGTGHEDCGWTDYGFVWGTSVNPTVTNDTHTTQVGTSGNATSWNGNLSGSFETGETYYFRAYGKNSKDDGEYVYGAGGSFTPRSVTFNSNGGSDVAAVYVNNGEAIVAPSVPTKTGYDFGGWQLSGAAYDFDALVSGNISLDAVWTAKTMDVTLDNQSATTAGTDKVTGTYDQGLPSIAANLPEKTGYDFKGYFAQTGGNGKRYIKPDGTADEDWDKESATTIYAHWTIKNYTVKWSVAGDDSYSIGVTVANNNANHGSTVTAPTAPNASALGEAACANTFMGWSKKHSGSEAQNASYYDDLFSTTSPAITENTTFYAVFANGETSHKSAKFDASNITATPATSNTNEWKHSASNILLKLSSGQRYTSGTPNTFTVNKGNGNYAQVTTATGQTVTSIDVECSSDYYKVRSVSSGASIGSAITSGTYPVYPITGTFANPFQLKENYTAQIRIVSITINYDTTAYTDYITECAPLTCSVPQSLASVPGKNGATLSWSEQEVGTASKYQYAVWAVGADEPTSGYSETTNLTATVSGLMSNTEYNWKVRTVCTGDDGESEFAKSTFTTGSVALTFSVPAGVSPIAASTSASALPSAGVPDACAGCWSFAGWSSNENATSVEYAAGGTYKFDDDKTLYAVYGKGSTTYERISEIEELATNENYIITAIYSNTEYALTSEKHDSYIKDAKSLDVTAKVGEDENGYYIQNPEANYIWKYTGTKLYNESANKYIQLSNYSSSSILDASGENLTFTVGNDGEWTIKNGSAYLRCYGSGFDASSSSSVYIYKRQMGSLTTAPDCSGHTIEWYVAGAKVRTDEGVSSCDGVASLPSVDVADVRCKTEGTTFMGWSETNVGVTPTSDADEIAALNLFTDAADAPAITADKQFYAVFAEGSVTGTESKTIKYSVATTSTLTSTGTSPEGTSATYSQTYNTACQMTKNNSATLTLKDWGTTRITKLVLSMKSNSSSGNGKLRYSIDGGTNYSYLVGSANSGVGFDQAAWNGDWSTSYVDITKDELAITGTNANDIIIQIEATANSLFCESYEITYDVPVYSYADYFTECCPQKTITLSGVDDEVGKHFESDKEEACEGETVTLTKTENGNYTFGGFTVKDANDAAVDGTMNNVTGEYTFTMPETAVTVTAAWNPKNYEATAASADEEKGSVEVSGGSIEGGKRYVAYGSTITLTATPVNGDHYFQNWTVTPDIPELDLTQNPLVITMPGNNIDVTANFGTVAYPALTLETNEAYTLTATLANGEAIPNMGAIRSGTALKVSYVLNGQNEKTGWTLTPATTYGESENYITFNMPSEALHVALAVRPYYTLGLSAENGSISAVSINSEAQALAAEYRVHAGEDVAVTAVPSDENYKFKEWVKTGDAATYSGASTTATLKVGTENMTLKAVFEAKATYNLTLNALGRTQEVIPALEGTDVASLLDGKNAVALKGYHFEGWSETEDGEAISSDALKLNGDKTVYAVYSAEAYYQKVTSTSEITDGQYLIVYENDNKAFNGGLSTLDAASNTIDVTINNDKIDVTDATIAAEFTISAITGGYSIKSASGKYIGRTSNTNGMDVDETTTYTNTLSIVDGSADIVSSSGAHLRYNNSSNQTRFRYYKSDSYSSQKAIQLYKMVAPGANESNPTTVVANNEVLVIDEDATLNNLTIEAGGKVETTNELTVINNLTIESEAGKSGQVSNAGNVHANNVYMDVTFYKTAETLDATSANQWYMISAPFDVNLNGGFFQTDGTPMVFTVAAVSNSFDLFEYDGSKRASTGKTGWKRASGKMKAGVAYLIGFEAGQKTTIRLKAANTTMTDKNAITLNTYTSTIGTEDENAKNSNWNGVANPNLHYISISKDAQTYNNDARSYNPSTSGSTSYVVGTAFFIHGDENASIVNTIHGDLRAPRRATEVQPIEFCVRLQQENASWANRMYIRASEEASAHYETGRDLETMNGTNGNNALLWSNNYGMRLAIEEAPIVNDKASYALSLYAPANGTYRIETPTESDNADLYLTKDGRVIWNLSMNGYEVELTKGTTEGYGLLLVRKAPSVATGVEEVESQESKAESAEKVIIDEHVYILRDGQMYDVTGKAVK